MNKQFPLKRLHLAIYQLQDQGISKPGIENEAKNSVFEANFNKRHQNKGQNYIVLS